MAGKLSPYVQVMNRALELDAQGQALTFPEHLSNGHTIVGNFNLLSALQKIHNIDVAADMLLAWEEDKLPLKERYPLHDINYPQCYYCGATDFATDGSHIIALSPCQHPDGFDLTIRLDIPSGRMIIGNDFRPEFDVADQLAHDINTPKGIINTIKELEADKAAHFFVGSSSPGVYQTGENQFMVASLSAEDELKEADKEVAFVSTELWWVTAVDGDEYDQRGCSYDADEVLVQPGTYVFTYNFLRKEFESIERSETQIYATIEKQSSIAELSARVKPLD